MLIILTNTTNWGTLWRLTSLFAHVQADVLEYVHRRTTNLQKPKKENLHLLQSKSKLLLSETYLFLNILQILEEGIVMEETRSANIAYP